MPREYLSVAAMKDFTSWVPQMAPGEVICDLKF